MKKVIKLIIFISLITICLPFFFKNKQIFADEGLVWIDTSHWEIQNQLKENGYWKEKQEKRWKDTSYSVNQGYWSSEDYYIWIDTSHWKKNGYWKNEIYKEWVGSGYYKTENYYEWIRSGYTVYEWIRSGYYQNYSYLVWVESGYLQRNIKKVWVTEYDPGWGINRQYPVVGSAGHATLKEYVYYTWINTSHWETRYGIRWIDTSHWENKYIDTSHWELRTKTYWVDTSRWENRARQIWIDTSYFVSSGYWEKRTGRHWIDTSYMVSQGYWETYTSYEWVDTSYYVTDKVWITSGYYATPMHGKIIVEKSPKYVFTKWHVDEEGKQSSMDLKITWEINNVDTQDNEQFKKINKVYVFEEVVRYSNKGIEKVNIFQEDVLPSAKGSIFTTTMFDYGGNEESTLYIYVYSENGEVGYVSFPNPVNSFRSINLYNQTIADNENIWLGGITYETFEF